MSSILERTRAAILEEFRSYIPGDTEAEKVECIAEATFTGQEDPGGWSPEAAVVIHTESGIPNPSYDQSRGFQIIEGWFRVSGVLGDHHAETVNGAAISVYES